MLTFPLKKKWWEKIKRGEKTVEYREAKPYWRERLINYFGLDTDDMRDIGDSYIYDESNPRAVCKLTLGYTDQYIIARIKGINVVDGKDTDLHIDKPVYAIHLSDIKEV